MAKRRDLSERSLYIEMKRPSKRTKADRPEQTFGQRLRRIRESRGFSQEQLGRRSGISQRMVAYYENHAKKAPAHQLLKMAAVLRVSLEELLGYKALAETNGKRSSRLWNKLRMVETLPAKDRKQVLQLIDTLVERERLRSER